MALVGCRGGFRFKVGCKSWKEGHHRDGSAFWLAVVAIVHDRLGISVGLSEVLVEGSGFVQMLSLLDVVIGIG